MNFTKYFRRKDYDNLDRFVLKHKFRSCRDPFEGDPFKIQSLNFRYADKPTFYPISNRCKPFVNEKSQVQNVNCNQRNCHYRLEKENGVFARKSPFVSKASSSTRVPSKESVQRGINSVGNAINFNRSRSFIHQPMSVPCHEEVVFPSNPAVFKKNGLKAKNSIKPKTGSDSMNAINVDYSRGCKINIKINGVPSHQVHINENCDVSQNWTKSTRKPAEANIASPYDIKPSRSYVIHRDASDICSKQKKSPSNILRECSTHSMIPHKEEMGTLKEARKSSSIADPLGASSSLMLKSVQRDNNQLNSSKNVSHSVCLERIPRKKPLQQRVSSELNLERQASMLEKDLSSNPILARTRNNFLLTKSKSVLDQRFTPLPMSGKYTFENNNSRTPYKI